MVKQIALYLILITLFILITFVQAQTSQLYCQNESQTWPQSGKIYTSNKIMFLRIEFSNEGSVKIYQGQDQVPLPGTYDSELITSVSKTEKGFERNLVINRKTGEFTDRYYVIDKGKEETAWIDRGNCEI